VDDAALGGRHRLQGDGAVGLYSLFRHAQCQLAQRLGTLGPIAVDIHHEGRPHVYLLIHHQARQEFQRGQRFILAADEGAQVLALDIQHQHGLIFFVRLRGALRHNFDRGAEVHALQQARENLASLLRCNHGLVIAYCQGAILRLARGSFGLRRRSGCGLRFGARRGGPGRLCRRRSGLARGSGGFRRRALRPDGRQAHDGVFRADAQNPAAAWPHDLDFDLFTRHAQRGQARADSCLNRFSAELSAVFVI